MKKILLLEDNLELASMIVKELESQGYKVDHATTPGAALRLLINNDPDLLLSDVMLPYTGGLDFVEALKEDAQFKKPVIIVTGMDKDILDSTRITADRVITKPFKMSELVEAVRTYLHGIPASEVQA